MSFDFNQAKQEAAEEAASDKWDKARLFHEKIVFCIRSIEEIDNPWYDASKATSAVSIFQLQLAFLWQGKRNSIQTTYRVTPEMRIMVARHPAPWHNMTFSRYQTKQGGYGYELEQTTPDSAACAWERSFRETVKEVSGGGQMLIAGDTVDGSLVEVNAILADMQFEPLAPEQQSPVSDETWQALTKGSLLCKSLGVVIIPPERERCTEYDGQRLLVAMRREWASRSASQAKSQL